MIFRNIIILISLLAISSTILITSCSNRVRINEENLIKSFDLYPNNDSLAGEVIFDKVSFSYRDDEPILNKLSFALN